MSQIIAYDLAIVIWINGTFGVGKTTTATSLVESNDDLRLFDPEWVGYLLQSHLKDRSVADFQDLAGWRRLVPLVAQSLTDESGDRLVAVQTVLVERYWHELRDGLTAAGLPPLHVVLDADTETLHARIDADAAEPEAAQWRHDHVEQYRSARPWLLRSADLVIDTTTHSATAAAEAIAAAIAATR